MKKNTYHNLRSNNKITHFKAPIGILQLFSGVRLLSKLTILFVFIVLLGFVSINKALSKRSVEINFGTEQILNIFPGKVETNDWSGIENVLIQDLNNDALYQEFNAKSSAYISLDDSVLPTQMQTEKSVDVEPLEIIDDIEETVVTSTETFDESETEDTPATEIQEEIIDESEVEESITELELAPESEPEEEDVDETVEESVDDSALNISSNDDFIFGVFKISQGLFSLTELNITSTTKSVVEPTENEEQDDELDEKDFTDVEDVEFELVLDDVVEELNESLDEPTTTEQSEVSVLIEISDEQMLEGVTDSDVEEDSTLSQEFLVKEQSEEIQDEILEDVTPLETEETVHEITLSGFETASLEPGQLVTGMQLRISFAAQLEEPASGTVPYVEVLFGEKEEENTVGVILIEDEVSNAINGGYQLFALPDSIDIDDLENVNVVLRYYGDKDALDGIFLDAVWLEVNTRIVTKEDLDNRGVASELKQLKSPEVNELVSDKINFERDEAPIFNLRYASQKNVLVQGIRSLVGKNLVEVEEINVRHNSFGLLGIQPEVNVTKDGLLTIEIPDDQLTKMRPGTYEIEIVLNEGGTVVVDTFNFEWGVLSINPSKSEYERDEIAFISVGALTPSGHTICEANLDLYVTNPDGLISKYEVESSGLCDGNNVVDVPDFYTSFVADTAGTYLLYLERLDDDGNVLSFTNDSFLVTPNQRLGIKRDGPTRIYPPAPYPMTLTVDVNESFTGVLTERVPKDFVVSSTTADIRINDDWQELTWDISILGEGAESVSYTFDAPDLSPYLYNLGPASLEGEPKTKQIEVASTTASTTEIKTITEGGILFSEHRQWQIASDAVGNMILYFDGASIPSGWTCLSCGSGTFYQKFVMGSSTYNTTGGATTHTHSVTTSLLTSDLSATESGGSGGPAIVAHTHTLSPTVSAVTNLPEYRQLQVIQYTDAAGEPAIIPAGAIAIFDIASSSLPANWNRYAAQDGKYAYGEDVIGTTGGSNTHTHTVSGTTGQASGGSVQSRGGGTQATGASSIHTHTISTTTESVNNEPPYIEVLFAQASTDVSPTNGIIAMWTEEVGGGWIDISSNPGDAFSGKFLKASTVYGATGGGEQHTHNDINNVLTNVTGTTATGRAGSAGSDSTHQHAVNFTDFSTEDNLPPYITAVFGKRQGTDPVYDQTSSRWYVNENTEPPTDPWPTGVTDLNEREPITATSTPLKDGDEIRLRINVGVTNATSSAGATFKLQFAAADTCGGASNWADVGNTSSSSVWRGYNNSGVSDHATISSQLLASTTVSETYEENGYATSTPNDIYVDDYGEWDFVLQQNGAQAGTNYCFRMIEEDGTSFLSYSHYPQLYTNEAPGAPTLEKLFDNEKTSSTSPWFYFYSTDTEGDKIHYEIEIDNNYDFLTPVIKKDTIDNSSQFENQVLTSDKAPFLNTNQIKFTPVTTLTNGSTYYWRVRGQDPEGSGDWGDWSDIRSFTIDTSLTASAWFQTEDEQFDTDILVGVETGSDEISLITGSSTGTTTSGTISFTDGELGTAWDSLDFTDDETSGDLKYKIEYLNDSNEWTLIPDSDLAGNSSGFDTSVSLLGLDVDTYSEIRVLALFTDSSGSPALEDWTINWGYRVDTPTVTKLFPNEQTGTTTPTFQFTTTDPQSDSLTYQIQWSLTPDFTASTTRTSDTDAGFVNLDAGGDLDPFNSGDDIQFTIQPADALTGTTTYWWRVRAKDTTGDNAYSFWTEEQSFTVIPGTGVSTWLQTTEEQFNTNILSGTIPLSSDAVTVATTATEAMIVYGEGTETTPRYRQWNGSDLSVEGNLLGIEAPLRWTVVKAAPTREEYIAVTLGTDGDVNAQVYSTGVWGDLQEMTVSVSNVSAKGFDVAYETISGDAMVAYCDGDADPSYYIWDGSSWTSGGTINLSSVNNCDWIQLESDPVSDEIIILSRDSVGTQYEAQVWDGSTWGNSTVQGTMAEAGHEGMAVMYEESGDQALIVTSNGNPSRFLWNSWNGTTWGTAANVTIGDDFEWGQMARDVGSDEIILCYQDEDTDAGVVRWTGSAWTGQTELQVDANDKHDPGFACVFEDTTARDNYILTSISDTAQTDYYTWNNTTWSTATQINSLGDTATAKLVRTGDAMILGAFFDDPNDTLRFTTWDGSTWSTTQDLVTDASVGTSPFGHPYSIAPRNEGRDGITVVSPALDFDDGIGPYWKEFSWNDSQPGSSVITYHLQYQTATGSWAFIPDTDLPDNETGTTTGPFDLSGLNTNIYNVIRPYAEMSCDASSNCPVLNDWKITWAGGIAISGTIQEYDESTDVTSGTVAVAVNGVLQTGKTGSISGGTWSIDNVTTFPGDIVTVFVTSATEANEAVGVTRYDGQGDISGMTLYERHLTLGSNDATTTPLTNTDIGLYDFTNTEDIFFDLTGSVLDLNADAGPKNVELHIKPDTYYSPDGNVVVHDIENNGTFTAGVNTIEINGSWDNNATTTMVGSTVVFAATSTTESIDNTGAITNSFNNVIFGTTTGNGVWTLASILNVDGDLTIERGTLARGNTEITLAGDLVTNANGFWTGIATTTFDGSVSATWEDNNAVLQNIGYVVVDGVNKIVTLNGNVAAQDINIGANDTLDASTANHDITLYGNWNNQNNFLARSGEVFFAATSSGKTITTLGDAFYDLSFIGVDGAWSFTENNVLVNNDFTVATGTVTLPTATSTIGGSFDASGGTFAHNNGVLYFTSNDAETIVYDGGVFTNTTYNITFNGGGSWTMNDTNATTSNDVLVKQGTVNFPSGVYAIGGTLVDEGGTFVGGTGTVSFYSSVAEIIIPDGSVFNSIDFNGTGSWSFVGTDVTALGDLTVQQGTLNLPAGTLNIGGSYDNNSVVNAGTGEVNFNSTDIGETIAFGNSSLYDVIFNGVTGGWTLVESATTTNNFTLATSGDWTLDSGESLSVGGVFTNFVGGASTTWTGSTLSLESGNYSVNTKTDAGDSYATLRIKADTDVSIWNSIATTYDIDSTGSLYSQDHNAVDGDLYIFGAYENTAGAEYWSYATDFDGTDLTGGSERQADVRFASGASATISGGTFEILGDASASTTIANQGLGTYVVNISEGTTTAQYYEFTDLGSTGVSFINGAIVSSLLNGSYEVATAGGSAITLSSTTIDANPGKQIFNVTFATTTSINAYNVSQTDGIPVSYWWFRNGLGNLYGEAKDNDTGDPGSVRFDDSSLVITVSGVVYGDAGSTPIAGGTCDGVTQSVRVVVEDGASYTGSCSAVDGSYSIGGVVVIGDPTLTVYLDNASGGEKGSVITRTPTTDIADMDIYANRVIVRNEDVTPLTIANLAAYDNNNDTDLQFIATTTSNPDILTVFAGNELFVFATSTFAPGGDVTLSANAEANSYDGTLYIDNDATFTGSGTSTYTIGGRLVLDAGATFNAASSSVLMNATTTGKSITSPSEITFHDLTFTGSGGGWNLGVDIQVNGDMLISDGTLTGTGDITLPYGSLTGNGVLSLGAGTTTVASSTTLGGTSAWTFYNLQLGDGLVTGTTTPVFTSTTTVSGLLTIETAHFLDAGATKWDLAGSGDVFVENGTFLEDISTVRYSGAGSNVLSTQYYNLDINSGSGAQTYTATGLGIIVDGDLTVGGDAVSNLDLNTNDPALDVNGNVNIRSNGTFDASDIAETTFAGSYDNNGTLTANGGIIEFDGAGTIDIAAGNSDFASVTIDATGDVTVSEHATATAALLLSNANSFTLADSQVLAVGGTFFNAVGGADTTWTNSILSLYGGNNYSINASSTNDSYATLDIGGTTQIRMWNSDAITTVVDSTASLYSQDHSNTDGDLYIWGAYDNTSNDDYWSYATDFDGTNLTGGSERKVDVYIDSGASVTVTGGSFDVTGDVLASTTIQNQGAGSYSLRIGGSASTSFSYYEIRDVDSNGLVLSGTPTLNTLSFGDLEVSQNGGTAMTVGGTVITSNPAKNFTKNRFALNGVASGFNVTATGTSVSSWRFANHYGDIDGEAFDIDPDGDPGYVAWDDSAALITISGNVYSDEGTTVSGVCDGTTNNVTLVVAGITSHNTSCNGLTGAYSVSNVSYGSGDSLIVYIDGETEKGVVVTKEPVSNIGDLDVYEDRVIVRHENINPIDIADMAVWDSSDDADIPFTAINAGTDTLTLPANTKLFVWTGKEFAPDGDVTLSGGGAGADYDGTLELETNSTWTGQNSESLSIGGSMILGTGANFTASNGTTYFTTTGAARTIDVNEDLFNNVQFTGSGSWVITDTNSTFDGDVTVAAGTVTFPTGTTTFGGSFINTGGSFNANNGLTLLTGSNETITLGGSDLNIVEFAGGDYVFGDTNATTTGTVTITSGDITLPSGVFAIGGDFRNVGGDVTHNTSELVLTNATAATVLASSSDLYAVTFSGGGDYEFEDENLSLLDSLTLTSGSMTLASGTMSIGGSFDASGGTFNNATGTILFNSADGGEIINAGTSDFYNVQISAPTGGYTITENATTTNNFSLASANSFTLSSGRVLNVEGVFLNSVGGSNTTWAGSTLVLDGANEYSVNTKSAGGDQYQTLIVGADSDLRLWNSAATTTTVDSSSSLYSQDNGGVDGDLYIFGDFHISTTTEYWSYATDFDGTDISGGGERTVVVSHAGNATTSVDGGVLQIVGQSGNETTITNQGSGTYSLEVSDGIFNAQYYAFRNLNAAGLNLSGTPVVSSLAYGDYELAVSGGTLITLASSTLNANASLVIPGNRFATTTPITGKNVTLTGVTSNAWTYTSHTGNLDGEDFDVDGASACGSIRWSDSSCLLTQQTHYRWRDNSGGLGVPNSEWFNSNWDARKRISVVNDDASTYTNAAVKITVAYDSDMQADFDDLRFTDNDGLTILPHWFGSTTDSTVAEVWVKIPSLASEEVSTIYMYYNNPSATTTSSSTLVFVVADDFEDGDINEYSGETSEFTVNSSYAYDGSYGLDSISDTARTESGGIYDLNQTVSQGETIRFKQYIDISQSDETCTLFGVQSASAPSDNYGVCLDLNGTDRIALVRDAVDSADTSPAVTLGSANISASTGWHTFEVDWGTDDSIYVTLTDESGTVVATTSATDSNYTSGGLGFTFWFQHGGWDSYTSRPTLTNEPSILFGVEQTDGGATWLAAEDTEIIHDVSDLARLRLVVENTGLAITDQQFLLEYAALGTSPSCEAVSSDDYNSVPVESSCGTAPVCMATSSYVINGASTFDLSTSPLIDFTAGEAREDPSNITGNLDIGQNEFTELEYVIAPTTNIVDQNLCFRVTDNGAEYDTYLSVAQMTLRFDPVVTGVTLNSGYAISLLPGTTTVVYATGTVSDLNGYEDLAHATSTIYRSGVGAACVEDDNNCYVSTTDDSCSFTNCVGNTCDIECTAEIHFHADPTDPGSIYEGEEWFAFIEVEDTSAGYDFDTSIGQDLNTLRAIDTDGNIDYGILSVNSDTGSTNASTTILNEGNVEVNIEISGSDLSDGVNSHIPANEQLFATSTFNYSSCGVGVCKNLSSTTPDELDVDLSKPTADFPPVEDAVYWGIYIPYGINSAPHQGINVFTPVTPS